MATSDDLDELRDDSAQFLSESFSLDSDGAVNVHSHQIHNVTDPTAAQDASTKNYVDTNALPVIGTRLRQPNLQKFYDDLTIENCYTNPVDIVVLGDSIVDLGKWPLCMERILANLYNHQTGSNVTNPTVGWFFCDPTTISGFNYFGSGNGSANTASLASFGGTLTVGQYAETTKTCDGVIVSWGLGAGTLTVKDGGSGGTTVATIDTTTGALASGNLTSINLTTAASHDIYIVASGGTCYLDGAYFTTGNRTAGVRVWQIGHAGWRTNNFNTASHGTTLIQGIKTLTGREPHVIVATGYNDTAANQITDMTTLWNTIDGLTTGGKCAWVPWNYTSDDKRNDLRDFIDSRGLGKIDALAALGSVYTVNYANSLSLDGVHPSANGRAALALLGAMIISGNPLGVLTSNTLMQDPTLALTAATLVATTITATAFQTDSTTGGNISIGNYGGYALLGLNNVSTDANAQVALAGSQLLTLLGAAEAGGGIAFGDGGASSLDTLLYRNAATTLYTNGSLVSHKAINAQVGTTYTLLLTDDGKFITCSNGSAIALTIPTNSSVAFPTGTQIEVSQIGAGQVTVSGAGVTINGTPGLKTRAQYSTIKLTKTATNTWIVSGDSAA